MKKSQDYKKLLGIAVIGIVCLFGAAIFCYNNVKQTIIQNEQRSLKSLVKVNAQGVLFSLEAKRSLVYAALSGDMDNEKEITEGLLKIGERAEFIPVRDVQKQEEWKKSLCREASADPGNVLVKIVQMEEEDSYALYMAKSVSVNGYNAGCGLIEFNLDDVYQKEQALSYLESNNERYCIVKNADGTTIMPSEDAKKNISLEQTAGSGCRIEWIYEPQEGAIKRIRKLVAYETIEVGGERVTLYIIEDYDHVIQMIERIALYFSLLGGLLVLWTIGFLYKIVKQQQQEDFLMRDLQHEKALNETMKKQEGLMQKYNHSKTMSVLTGSIAHEFNNLMTPIVLYTELLEENEVVSGEMPEEISELASAAKRCGELARQLLSYSRQGRAEKVFIDYDATYAVNEAVSVVKKLIPTNIDLKTNISKKPYYIHGQAGTLNQILLNLTTNAVHAMKGGGIIRIQFGLSSEDEKNVRLIVEDTGTGISEEIRQKVFHPFFTTKGDGEGSGIGLTVVRRLVEEHGGTVRVKTEEGKGTTFIIDFPRVKSEAIK